MSNDMTKLRQVYDSLSTGEKCYLANKLWKKDLIVAQRIRQYIPEHLFVPEPQYVYEVLDEVRQTEANETVNDVDAGTRGIVVEVDHSDPQLPYRVFFGDEVGYEWCREDMLEAG